LINSLLVKYKNGNIETKLSEKNAAKEATEYFKICYCVCAFPVVSVRSHIWIKRKSGIHFGFAKQWIVPKKLRTIKFASETAKQVVVACIVFQLGCRSREKHWCVRLNVI